MHKFYYSAENVQLRIDRIVKVNISSFENLLIPCKSNSETLRFLLFLKDPQKNFCFEKTSLNRGNVLISEVNDDKRMSFLNRE